MDARIDNDGIKDIVTEHSGTVYRLAFSYMGNRYDAEDVMQEVFCRYVENGGQSAFKSEEHERAWIIRVTVNCCKSLLTSASRKRTVSLDEATDREGGETFSAIESPVLEAVLRLNPSQRLCIHLFYYEDLPISEIAERAGMKQSTVKSHLRRGRKELEKMLKGAY